MCHYNTLKSTLWIFIKLIWAISSDTEIKYIVINSELYSSQQYWYPCLLNKSELTVENNLQVYQPLLMELFIATKLKGHFMVFWIMSLFF